MCAFPDLSHPLARAFDEASFSRLLNDEVRKYRATNSRACLADLLRSLPSVYPATVFRALKAANNQGRGSTQIAYVQTTRRAMSAAAPSTTNEDGTLPHPLDSEWRFTRQTTDTLLERMSLCSSPAGLWIGLGTPSILKAKDEAASTPRMILFDSNSALKQLFPKHPKTGEIVICDLFVDPLPSYTADVVVADPPWYYEEMAMFLWAARQMCRMGGKVFLSTPKVGTRPGIGSDLKRLDSWISRLGFVTEAFERDVIEYQSPFFERNALRAEGVSDYPDNWRRADLLVLRREKDIRVARPRPFSFERAWEEVSIGTMRLRVLDVRGGGFRDPSLRSLTAGDQPASVSRRDPRKQKAKIWTSGNRVFDCIGGDLFLSVARAIEAQKPPTTAVEATLGRRLTRSEAARVQITIQQLHRLAATEEAEVRAIGIDCKRVAHRSVHLSSPALLQMQDAFRPEQFGAPANVGVHIAVFIEPFLGFLIEGRKTVESRFSLTRRAPFKQVAVGDLVLLKKSGGPIVGSCRVAQTWFYVIDPASWKHIRTEFAQAICAQDPDFWSTRAGAKYATLLQIEDVRTFPPRNFVKKDRRGWVVLHRSAKTIEDRFL